MDEVDFFILQLTKRTDLNLFINYITNKYKGILRIRN